MYWLFALHLLNFLPWWAVAIRAWRQELPYLLVSLVLFQFTWVSPVWLWANQVFSIAGIAYQPSFPEALAVYIIGVGILNTSWLASRQILKPAQATMVPNHGFKGISIAITMTCLCLALLSYRLSGIEVLEVFNPFNRDIHVNLYGLANRYPILEGFADSLIPATVLMLLFGGILGAIAFVPVLWLLVFAGFRYRLILLVLTLFFHGLIRVRPTLRPWLVTGTLLAATAGLLLLTVNRGVLVSRAFYSLGWNKESINMGLIINETNNCQTFMACLASPHRESLTPDGGRSLYWATAVRFLPKALFPNNQKPRPHTLQLIRLTYSQTEESRKLNPALSCLEEYYLSAGIPGLVLAMGALGLLCSWLGRRLAQAKTQLGLLVGCMASAFLFQVVTRGYMPQQVELALYLSLPFLAMYLYDRYGPTANRNSAPKPDGPFRI